MKTRRSNRAKTRKPAVVDDLDLDIEDGPGPQPTQRTADDDDDEEFKPPSPSNAPQDDDEEDPSDAEVDLMELDNSKAIANNDNHEESDFSGKEKATPRRRAAREVKRAPEAKPGYTDITTIRSTLFVQGYTGPYDRGVKGNALLRTLYGPDAGVVRRILARWYDFSVLPPKIISSGLGDEPGMRLWTQVTLQQENDYAKLWLREMKAAQSAESFHVLTESESQPYRDMSIFGRIPVLVGPADDQKDVHLSAGDSITISSSGAPGDQAGTDSRINGGWLFDAGGIVTSLAWKPTVSQAGTDQLLALAVIPHDDQVVAKYVKEAQNPNFMKHGVVQIWSVTGNAINNGPIRPSSTPAKCQRILCLDQGRAKMVQWTHAGGILAILCSDGAVYIVEPVVGGNGDYEKIEHPIAILNLGSESTKATAMAWINCNRLSIGYTDGSIALWSICPTRMLSRHPIHHNYITGMASAYPTCPYLISVSPLGGPSKLVDLRSPAYETTESTTASVTSSSGLVSYSDHLLGFYFPLPSANAMSTVVGFNHLSYYPTSRRVTTPDSFVSCISTGRTHPYLLIGALDGTLWSLNPLCELFSVRYEISDRIRIFQHEHRKASLFEDGTPGSERGACRILQGFRKEKNPNPRIELAKPAPPKKGTKKGKGKGPSTEAAPGLSKEIIHEPLTRITAVQWNPNPGYGCWAAAAMGSGLVRIMDLGLELDDAGE